MTLEDAVDSYIRLRDMVSEKEQAFKEEKAKLQSAMDKLESLIMLRMDEQGVESVRTKSGTAYKSTRTSATVADWDQVLAFIQTNELWPMLERRVNKSVVEQYKTEHGEVPPGVNWAAEYKVNVRRS
jgi:nanoRNase/pAp phosphatase (c-di-AMP/oligoRNAs hydrolase)